MNVNLTYNDLMNQFLNWVKNTCCNIDSIKSNVPGNLKSGYNSLIKQYNGSSISYANSNKTNNGKTIDMREIIANPIPTVSTSVVTSQFNTYMANCGFSAKSSNKLSDNGVLTFWNAAANFVAGKIYNVKSRYTDDNSRYLIYRSDVSVSNVSNIDENSLIKASNVNEMKNILKSATIDTKNVYNVYYNYTISAATISSSSQYIAYIKL